MIGVSANCQEALCRALGAHSTLLNIFGVMLLIKPPYPLQLVPVTRIEKVATTGILQMTRQLCYFHRKGADEPDPPGAGTCDVPEALDTQRDKRLLKTEPLQEARPKWNKGGGGATSSGT